MSATTRYVLRGVAPLGGAPTDLLLAGGVIAAIGSDTDASVEEVAR